MNQLCTVSRRISGETSSPTIRNQTNVISVKRCGYHKEDSPHRALFQSRPQVTSNILVNLVCINSEKCFRTVWKVLSQEFPVVFDQCAEQTLWNEARDIELRRPLTQEEEMRRNTGIPHEQIAHDRLWNKRPDGIAFKIPTKTKVGVIFLLEFNHMSDVTSHCIVRAKRVAEAKYASLRSALAMTMNRQG